MNKLPPDIVKVISDLSGIKKRYLLDLEQLEYVVDYESDIVSLSSRGTRYSGFVSLDRKCMEGINCYHGDRPFDRYCSHYCSYDRGMGRTDYAGNMSLAADMWYKEDLIFEDDYCFACDENQCDLINLRCGCTYHKSCIRRYLEKGREEYPGCHPVVCQACINCSY